MDEESTAMRGPMQWCTIYIGQFMLFDNYDLKCSCRKSILLGAIFANSPL